MTDNISFKSYLWQADEWPGGFDQARIKNFRPVELGTGVPSPLDGKLGQLESIELGADGKGVIGNFTIPAFLDKVLDSPALRRVFLRFSKTEPGQVTEAYFPAPSTAKALMSAFVAFSASSDDRQTKLLAATRGGQAQLDRAANSEEARLATFAAQTGRKKELLAHTRGGKKLAAEVAQKTLPAPSTERVASLLEKTRTGSARRDQLKREQRKQQEAQSGH